MISGELNGWLRNVTFEYPDSSGEVIDSTRRFECSCDDAG